MKILTINSLSVKGGSESAMNRLIDALKKKYDIENQTIVGHIFKADKKKYHWSRQNRIYHIIEGITNRFTSLIGLQYLFLPISRRYILKYTQNYKPDVIQLHNHHGGFLELKLIKKLSNIAPIVWTLHDMYCFTGHCVYSYNCEKWKNGCKKCKNLKSSPAIGLNTTKLLWKLKKKTYSKSNFYIVTPSKWLADLARKSPLLENKKIFHIRNGIDTKIFNSKNSNFKKEELGIPKDAKVLTFCAVNLKDPRKGGKLLLKILEELDKRINYEIHLITIGDGQIKQRYQNLILHNSKTITSEKEMAATLNAGDLLIFPTKADNLPYVLIESIACGTPAITFDIGGCKEIILNNEVGYIIKPFDINEFVTKIINYIENNEIQKKFKNNTQKEISNKYSIDIMCDKYFKIYNTIKNEYQT